MNKKGFTLVELLAVLIVLGIVAGFASTSIVKIMNSSKAKSEEAFVETIKDAMDVYLSGGEAKGLSYNNCTVAAYSDYQYATITFDKIVNSKYKPINKNSLVNPANNKQCFTSSGLGVISVSIYRIKEVYSYYYKIDKNSPGFNNCFEHTTDSRYISNLEKPGEFKCL